MSHEMNPCKTVELETRLRLATVQETLAGFKIERQILSCLLQFRLHSEFHYNVQK